MMMIMTVITMEQNNNINNFLPCSSLLYLWIMIEPNVKELKIHVELMMMLKPQ